MIFQLEHILSRSVKTKDWVDKKDLGKPGLFNSLAPKQPCFSCCSYLAFLEPRVHCLDLTDELYELHKAPTALRI